MAKLSKRDEQFLARHGISLELLFDASGLPSSQWKTRMRQEGKLFAFGVHCLRGHRLKTRSGNCIRCNTANIAFQMRSGRDGYVYIARSASRKLTKIGFSADDPWNRIYIANLEGYAGASDWRIVQQHCGTKAGRWELAMHATLREHRKPQVWYRNGESCEAREVYGCTLREARAALALAIRE